MCSAKSLQSCLTLCDPMDCSLPGSSVSGTFQARILELVAMPFFRVSSWPRDWIHVSCIAAGFFTDESPGRQMGIVTQLCPTLCDRPHVLYSPWNSPGQNTGVGSLSLLQGIFPTQGLNPGLPHCRWMFYQLNHKRSPLGGKKKSHQEPI